MAKRSTIARAAVSAAFVAAICGGLYLAYFRVRAHLEPKLAEATGRKSEFFLLVKDKPDTLQISPDAVQAIQLKTAPVEPAPPPDPLRLPGSLGLDPNLLVPVHTRFPGEVARLAEVDSGETSDGRRLNRAIRYGDTVKQGQILAIIWSKDVGEKKSELVDALSRLDLDQRLLQRLSSFKAGTIIPEKQVAEAQRNVESDLIAIEKAVRTLRSWRLTEDEIEAVKQEAAQLRQATTQAISSMKTTDLESLRTAVEQLHAKTSSLVEDTRWAELEVRAAIDGVIVEKNVNVGAIVDPSDDLFQIADLSRIQVLASVYEEDLPFLELLPPEQRDWAIDLKSDPHDKPIPGKFEMIGKIIDPAMHTGALIGWLDNREGRLRVGQFITATIQLPADPAMVAIPTSALIEEGDYPAVFVESDARRHEVSRRKVAVTRRGRQRVFIHSEPTVEERRDGAESLAVGEQVIVSGGLELFSELINLQAAGQDGAGEAE
ncbi:MAG TPA: efflux RND transporter periplasmic adaptor subunit [Pirellulales bacterium]|nr:efflux RND transporter periplasmic adaptor subunit [Pirellulales bacterium]